MCKTWQWFKKYRGEIIWFTAFQVSSFCIWLFLWEAQQQGWANLRLEGIFFFVLPEQLGPPTWTELQNASQRAKPDAEQ